MIATLGPEGVWLENPPLLIPVDLDRIESISELFAGMLRRNIDVLHVHASALPHLGLPVEVQVPMPGQRRDPHPFIPATPGYSSRALSPSITWEGREIMIGAYQEGSGDPFAEAADARELLFAHIAFSWALAGTHGRGWEFRRSAIETGWRLMHAPWEKGRRKEMVELMEYPEELRLPTVHGTPQVEQTFGSWAVAESRRRPRLPVTIGWDINGQRLAAAGGLRLGLGDPIEWGGPHTPPLNEPGYHLIKKTVQPYKGLIPPLMERGWHTSPRVKMAQALGLDFEIERSIYWPASVAYLDPFYERMRDARTLLMQQQAGRPAQLALGALKEAYLKPFGRLRSSRIEGSRQYRPSWYDHVIGQEVARQYYRLHQLATLGVQVSAVYFDTIVIEAETRQAPPPIEVSGQLGKYKLVGHLPTEEARGLLYTPEGPRVGDLVKALKRGGTGAEPAPHAPRSVHTRPPHGGYPDPKETR